MTNDSLKAKVEAALFLTEKPLRADAVARIVNADTDIVRQTILELIHDYESREGGLEIADDGGYIVQVKDQYTTLIDEFVPIDMPTALIRTLSAIAIKQPVMQSEIIKLRGAGAYDHIKELIIRELVNKREDGGRSPLLTTTKKFQEYFRLSKDGKSLRSFLSDSEKPSGDALGDLEATQVPITVGDTTIEAPVELPSDTTIGILAEEKTFDMSPEPGTPSIGTPGQSDKESEETRSNFRQDIAAETRITVADAIVETVVSESASLEPAE